MAISPHTEAALIDPVVFDMALQFVRWRANQTRTDDLIVAARRVLVDGEAIARVAEDMGFSSRQYLHQIINTRFKPVLAQAQIALDSGFQPVRPAAAKRTASTAPKVAASSNKASAAKKVSAAAPAKAKAAPVAKKPGAGRTKAKPPAVPAARTAPKKKPT